LTVDEKTECSRHASKWVDESNRKAEGLKVENENPGI
jgi:hypothetical protein